MKFLKRFKPVAYIMLGFIAVFGAAASYQTLIVNSSGVCSQNVNFTGTAQLNSILIADQQYVVDHSGGSTALTDFVGGRLSLATGVPVMTADSTSSTTLYFTPYADSAGCGLISLYKDSAWSTIAFDEVSLSLSGLNGVYDIFGYNDSGSLALYAKNWLTSTARSVDLTKQNGRYVCGSSGNFVNYAEANRDDRYVAYNGGNTMVGQAITTAVSHTISSVKFYLAKNGSPTGNAVAKLYAATGTPGSTGVPTGEALATSGTLDVSTLTGSYVLYEFTFGTPYTAAAGNYCVTIEYAGGNASNNIYIGCDVSSPTHAGNAFKGTAVGSCTTNAYDLIFYLYESVETGAQYRYLGTINVTNGTSYAVLYSAAEGGTANCKLDVWNYYNRRPARLWRKDTTNPWTYNSTTIRQANGAAGNQCNFVIGVAEDSFSAKLQSVCKTDNASYYIDQGITLDSTTAFTSGYSVHFAHYYTTMYLTNLIYTSYPTIGAHYVAWLEREGSGGTATVYGGEGPCLTLELLY